MEKEIKIGESVYTVSSDDAYLAAMGSAFEPDMVQLLQTIVRPDDVVADIGANIGITAILFSSLAKLTYAFEPSPSTFRILSENITRNAIANVDAINLGLGNKKEMLTITFPHGFRAGGFVSDKIRPRIGFITEEISIDTLDNFFSCKKPLPTFLKIDVEGYEQNVIRGGEALLRQTRPTVVMEMNHFCLDVLRRITLPDFLDFMRSVFPYLYAIDQDNTSIIDLHEQDKAYMVMHEHVVKHRFPNIVGGFDSSLKKKLERLEKIAQDSATRRNIKTPALSLPAGKLVAQTSNAKVGVGSLFQIKVSVENKSKEIWYGYGKFPVYLSYHWMESNYGMLVYDGIRTELIKPYLAPGETIEQSMSVVAPMKAGKFKLVLTMLQEGVCWFEDKGFEPAVLDVEIA